MRYLLFLTLLIPTNANSEFLALVDGVPKVSTSTAITPIELAILNSSMTYKNFSDLIRCVNDKNYLTDKVDDIKPSEARKKATEITVLRTENAKR